MANALPDFKQKVDHLIDAVMVAGRFDVPVPQSIALRLLGNEHRAYQVAFHDCRILREREVTAGVYELTPRQPLEAEIWCQRRIPQKEDQFGLVREMAINIRSCEIGNDHSLETTFVVDLLRGFGPQGRLSDRVVQFYPRIAEVLDELRRQHTRVSPRLLLIKSHVTREWIGIKEQKLREDTRQRDLCAEDAAMIRNEWLPPVREAVTSVQQAIDMVCPPDCQDRLAQGARQLLATLFTELACTLGTEQACLHLLSRCSGETASSSISAIDVSLNDAMRAWQRALVYDEDSVQTHDAACWILRNRLEGPGLSAEREVELLVRWEEIIEQFRCLNLSDQQQDSLDGREAELQRARGDIDRFEAVLARMTERGSLAVHVLRSRFLVQDQGLDAARSYLEQNCGDSLLADRSVLLCYYRLWWQTETGEVGYFDHDSLVLPFSPHQWTRLAELAEARLQLDGEHDNCTALFHLGWALL
jgi:hypothetical protein